jgi:hypothetical protein
MSCQLTFLLGRQLFDTVDGMPYRAKVPDTRDANWSRENQRTARCELKDKNRGVGFRQLSVQNYIALLFALQHFSNCSFYAF